MKLKEIIKKFNNKDINVNLRYTIIAIILITIFCIALTPVTLQNDTYYTIKIGEHITQSGIDMKDPFSWHQDLNYTYPHWLYDLITYFIYSMFGFNGIYVATCLLSVILGLTIYTVNKKLLNNQLIAFLLTIGVMYLIKGYIAARAQLVTFTLFIIEIYLIEKLIETKKIKYAIGLVIIPLVIANMHLAVFPFYFVLYLPYIAEYIIARFSERIIYRKASIKQLQRKLKKLSKTPGNEEKIIETEKKLSKIEAEVDKVKIKRSKELQEPYKVKLEKKDGVKMLLIVMIIALLTGFLTPLGTTPYTYLIKTMDGNTTQNINEHLPMTLSKESEVLCTFIFFLAILMFTKTKIRLCDLFMLGGLAFLMLASRRQTTIYAIVCSIILGRLIIELFGRYSKGTLEKITKNAVTNLGIMIITIAMLVFSYYMAKDKFDDKYIDEKTYPVQACDFILNNINIDESKFYNEYNYGSYMLYRGIPVFIDSRADLYAPEFSGKEEDIFMDFIETSGISKFYGDIFDKYGITHVITYKKSKMNMIIEKADSEKYKELYKDDYFAVYEIIK